MKITQQILDAAAAAAATMHTETECVHVYSDGSVAVGTVSGAPSGVAYTYHPERAADPWDCFKEASKTQQSQAASASRWYGSEEFRARISEEARRSLPGYE